MRDEGMRALMAMRVSTDDSVCEVPRGRSVE